jgi:hypothetical protein
VRIDPAAVLLKPVGYRSVAFSLFLFVYIAVSIVAFVFWVNPSLTGRSDQHIAADSTVYIYFADTLREGRPDPFVLAALTTFPNNLWVPVLLALALNSTVAVVLANYLFFTVAILLCRKCFAISTSLFVCLLALNPTTMISLLSVNKESVDFLSVALFFFARFRRNKWILFLALAVALVNRFELCALMVVFMVAESALNPVRRRRWMTLAMVTLCLGIALPLFGSHSLSARFEEARLGGMVTWLDLLEMHYLYPLAVVPKVAENLFGELINVSAWKTYTLSDLANSYILLFNNLAALTVFIVLIGRRLLTLKANAVYFAAMGCILMASAMVIQPRYFYFVYVLLCLQAARPPSPKGRTEVSIAPKLAGASAI